MRHSEATSKNRKTVKKLWIAVIVLAVLAPIGLILPAFFGAGGAWGEWGAATIKELVGYAPAGMERLSHLWKSPLPDYTVPGQQPGLMHKSLGYIAAAFIGIAAAGGIAYALARLLGRKDE